MPPGRPRGSGAGRARGRGRGGASAPSTSSQAEPPIAAEQPSTSATQQSQNEIAALPVIQPEQNQPASAAVPVSGGLPQRLDSAKTPHAASPTPGPSSKIKKPIAQPRFTGRRSKEERDAREFEAAQREKARRAETALQGPPTRASRDRARGRGRGRGRGGSSRDILVAGTFSGGTYSADTNRGRFIARSSGWPANSKQEPGGSHIKKEPRGRGDHGADGDVAMTGGSGIKTEDYDGLVSSDDDDDFEGRRKNIEYINLVSDDEDEANAVLDTLAPVRVRRIEHKDRVMGINTDTSSTGARPEAVRATAEDQDASSPTSRKGKARAKDVEVIGSERVWKGVYQDEEETQSSPVIKPEPAEEDVEMHSTLEGDNAPTQLEASTTLKEPPSSPETSKRNLKVRRKPTRQAASPNFQTEEERKEWERYQSELTHIINELTTTNVEPPVPGKEGDATATEPPTPARDDGLYLFQFPPKLPDLQPVAVKAEPAADGDNQDMPMSDAPAPNPAAPIKVEDDGEDTNSMKENVGPHLSSGFAGKLRVHASGKATLDWGGTSLELHVGMHANFLQEAVMCRIDNRGSERIGGECMPFGRVKGKFVVTPDWEEILGSPIRMA